MDYEDGAPYYEARVTGKPVRRIDGTVIVRVAYCQRHGGTIARFYNNQSRAMELKDEDIIHVCPFDGDAYI